MTEPVVKTIEVACTAAQAFVVFVERTSLWWPMDAHSVSAGQGKASQKVIIEPRIGGAVYEVMFDGERAEWGKVQAYEEGRSIVMSWHPGTSTAFPTQVAVEFEDIANGRARVTLTHSGWEIWADEADQRRDGYNNGWVKVFEERFAAGCNAA